MANEKREKKEKQKQKIDIIAMARKKRHIHLLNKLQKNKPLSGKELKELEKFESGPLSPGAVRTQEEVAKALHVSVRTVQYWARDGMPRTPEDYYDLTEVQAWRMMKSQLKGKTEPEREKYITEWYKNRAKLSNIAVKKADGELISVKDVKKGNNVRVLAVRRNFLAVPKHIAPALEGKTAREIEPLLREVLEDICNQFAEQGNINETKSQEKGQNNLESGREGIVEIPAKNHS